MLTKSQVERIVSKLTSYGWRVRPNGNSSHYVVYPPKVNRILTIHDGKSTRLKSKLLCDLRRVGITKEQIASWKL